MPDIIKSNFPTRVLNISKVICTNFMLLKILVAICFISAFSTLYLTVPGIYKDYKVSQNPVEIDARFKGKCETRLVIATNCDITLSYKGKSLKRYFSFFDFHSGDYHITTLTSPDDPSWLTVDLAVDKLWSRIVMLLSMIALMIGGGIVFIKRIKQAQKMNELLAKVSGNKLIPVLIPINITDAKKEVRADYHWPDNADGEKYFAEFNIKEEDGPFIVKFEGEQAYALGVTSDANTIPIILDKGLLRVDLTDQERSLLLSAA